MSDKIVKYESRVVEAVTKPESWVDPEASEFVVPQKLYRELLEKFQIVNYEYNRLSNYWMGHMAQVRPTQQELDLFEKRGQRIFDLGKSLLRISESQKWYNRLFFWFFRRVMTRND